MIYRYEIIDYKRGNIDFDIFWSGMVTVPFLQESPRFLYLHSIHVFQQLHSIQTLLHLTSIHQRTHLHSTQPLLHVHRTCTCSWTARSSIAAVDREGRVLGVRVGDVVRRSRVVMYRLESGRCSVSCGVDSVKCRVCSVACRV